MNFVKTLIKVALVLTCTAVGAQPAVNDLAEAIERGTVLLERSNGTGASSGSSVEGVITNETDREINIDVFISNPIYLVNEGSGQNMVATQVYGRNGGYMRYGDRSFITLKPREQSRVTFIAYCVDFEKENPRATESFTVGEMPGDLSQVVRTITSYTRANQETDITVAAQVAVWLAQGESAEEIAKKFSFSAEDERRAYELLK